MKRLISSIVALVVMLSLVAVPAALAGPTGDTGVTGNLPIASLEVTAPADITLGTLFGTGNATGSSTTNGTVLCTMYTNGYTLNISSDKADGNMTSNGNTLLAALLVTATLANGTGAEVIPTAYPDNEAVNTTPITVGSTTAPAPTETGTNNITLSVKQPKQTTGVGGNYSLNLTFTASVNA